MRRPGGVTPPEQPDPQPDPIGPVSKPKRTRPARAAAPLKAAKVPEAPKESKATKESKAPKESKVRKASRTIKGSQQIDARAATQPVSAVPAHTDDDADRSAWWLSPRGEQQHAEAERGLVDAERRRKRFERAEARRFTRGTRLRRRRILVGAAAAGAFVALVLLTAYSPLLAVRTITVEGTNRIDASAVSDALSSQLGRPLTLVDFGEVESDLAAFPLIQSYVTESRPPDTLVIRIVERQPVASVAVEGGFDLLDPAGVVVENSPRRPAGYPLIDAATTTIDSAGYDAAGEVLLALGPGFLAQLDSISAPTPDSITFVLADSGRRVVWGGAEKSALKTRILGSLVANPGVPAGSELDVSSPEAPVIR